MLHRVSAARWIIPVAAVEAAATGLVLLIVPSLLAWLIFGPRCSDLGQAMGRLAGIAMIGTGLAAWWPLSAAARSSAPTVPALTIYNLLAMVYLAYLGIAGHLVGILLWPAVALHAVLFILLGRDWLAVGQK